MLQSQEMKEQIIEWMNRYPFEGFMTLTLEDKIIEDDYINKMLLKWVRNVQIEEKIQIGYIGVSSQHSGYSRKHIHLLLCGRNRFGKTLRDCNHDIFSQYWHPFSKLEMIHERDRLIQYLIDKNMVSYEMVTPYNLKLLKRLSKN